MGDKLKKYRFLLGGHDLEMLTIRQLLDEYACRYEDRNLQWGAKLSAYADILNTDDHFVGIELIEDIDLPAHYQSIDHHNDKSHLPSSLEQLASMLGHNLTRHQQLVAANDKGYIPGMKAIDASNKEIEEIRRKDRAAQGVTEQDEELAVESIENHLTKNGNLTLVESLTPKFSPITDRLYPTSSLLISHHNHFMYYGIGTKQLTLKYKNLVEQGKAFHGGGDQGFFGLAEGVFDKSKASELENSIINLILSL